MPDWKALVRERLNLIDMPSQEQKETVTELAAHLEDVYQHYCAQGFSDSRATALALQEIEDRNLSKAIQRAKQEEGCMNARTKQFWMPGLASIAVAIVLPPLVAWASGIHVYIFGLEYHTIRFDVMWLMASILGGSVGAYLCRRAGGELRVRFACALFPAAGYFLCILYVLSAGVLESGHFITPVVLTRILISCVGLPGAAMLFGALPFLYSSRLQDHKSLS